MHKVLRVIVVASLAVTGLVLTPRAEAATWDPSDVTIAVIDTGIRLPHQEFDWDGSVNGPNGQMVGWWDFSSANQTGLVPDEWYETRAPYDPHGHGTGTAGMAAGLNANSSKDPSACPGCNLAMAKVANDSGGLDGSISAAIRWAVDVIDADVISISIGQLVPLPEAMSDVHDTAGYARSQGKLVVFANGNGWGNLGLVPGQPGTINGFAYSTNALNVGADGLSRFLVTTDPEVTAKFSVRTSHRNGGYGNTGGTSFSAPFVAGGAARILAEAISCGAPLPDGDRLERIIKITAYDNILYPPTFEGYGDVKLSEVAYGADVVCGRVPEPTPNPVTELYVERVAGTIRAIWADQNLGLGLVEIAGAERFTRVPFSNQTPAGVIGTSAGTVGDAEIYETTVAPGATLEVDMAIAAAPGSPDIDLFVVVDGAVVTQSVNSGSDPESVRYINRRLTPVTVQVIAMGFLVKDPASFTLTGVSGAPSYDGYVVSQPLLSR